MRVVSEAEFAACVRELILSYPYAAVTGPGRSGAVAAVYVSHTHGIPFVPYGQPHPGPVLVVDTTQKTGATMRKAMRRYDAHGVTLFQQSDSGRLKFWYEPHT